MKIVKYSIVIIATFFAYILFVDAIAYGSCDDEKRQIKELEKQVILQRTRARQFQDKLARAEENNQDLEQNVKSLTKSVETGEKIIIISEKRLYLMIIGTIFVFFFGVYLGVRTRSAARQQQRETTQ